MKLYTLTKDLVYKNQTSKLVYTAIAFKVTILLLIGMVLYYSHKTSVIEKEIRVSIAKQKAFTESNFKEYLLKLNVKHPDIVFVQARLETGDFTSKVFKENNNLFGMKVATCRPTTSNQSESGYAYYETWQESVLDYAFYQAKYLSSIDRWQYMEYLGAYYAEDPAYSSKLNELLKK